MLQVLGLASTTALFEAYLGSVHFPWLYTCGVQDIGNDSSSIHKHLLLLRHDFNFRCNTYDAVCAFGSVIGYVCSAVLAAL